LHLCLCRILWLWLPLSDKSGFELPFQIEFVLLARVEGGLTDAVCLSSTSATLLACWGHRPRHVPTFDRCFHLWIVPRPPWMVLSKTCTGQPNGFQCFRSGCVRVFENSWWGESFSLFCINGVSINASFASPESAGPQIVSDCFGPSLVAMNKHCSCKFLKDSDSSFGNPTLVACVDSGKRQRLSFASTCHDPFACFENSVVGVTSLNRHSSFSCAEFESFFA
jgi:hypothetical protein